MLNISFRCAACGIKDRGAIDFADGIRIQLPDNWRCRNSAYVVTSDGMRLPGSAVTVLCSEICERRYGEAIGFADKEGV